MPPWLRKDDHDQLRKASTGLSGDHCELLLPLHALVVMVRAHLELSYSELADRVGLSSVAGYACCVVDVSGLLHDGCATPCTHPAQSSLPGEMVNGRWTIFPELRYSGTSGLTGFLASGGIFSVCRRPKAGKSGFFHCNLQHFDTSLQYAWPCGVESLGRTFWFRCVIELHCYCWGKCGDATTWHYTRLDCRRYAARRLLFIPCASCRHVAPIDPYA